MPKATTLVDRDASVALLDDPPRFVSRGGDKLAGALRRFGLGVRGRAWLDAGASTGGFTDALLQAGAARVLAVDVGYGQMDWRLRNDPRVTVLERTNVRDLRPSALPWPIDAVTADLSFISLRLALPSLVEAAGTRGDFVLLVKPQFEIGRASVGRGGVVRDPEAWTAAIEAVVDRGGDLSLGLAGVAPAWPPGPSGNREFFVWLRSGEGAGELAIARAVAEAAP